MVPPGGPAVPIFFEMDIGGKLDVPALPTTRFGVEISPGSVTLNKLYGRRGVVGTSGTTTIVLEVNGVQQATATLSWTTTDAAFALKTVTFTPVSIVLGDAVSLALTSAEAKGQDVFVVAVSA